MPILRKSVKNPNKGRYQRPLQNKCVYVFNKPNKYADRQFLLSLSPKMKELSNAQKLNVQIEFQQVLLRYIDKSD